MFSNAYLKIAERLDAILNQTTVSSVHGKLQFIALYNNQFQTSNQEHVMPKPAILIQFADADWKTKANGIQQADCLIRLHIGMHNIADDNFYSSTKSEALKVDDYLDIIQEALQGFSAECLGSMKRTKSYHDESHDHIFVQVMEYTASITDDSGNKKKNYIDFNAGLEVEATNIVKPAKDSPYIIEV